MRWQPRDLKIDMPFRGWTNYRVAPFMFDSQAEAQLWANEANLILPQIYHYPYFQGTYESVDELCKFGLLQIKK